MPAINKQEVASGANTSVLSHRQFMELEVEFWATVGLIGLMVFLLCLGWVREGLTIEEAKRRLREYGRADF